MSGSSGNSVQDRIRLLKSARARAALDNRRAVYNEASGLKSDYLKQKKLEKEADEPEEIPDLRSKERGPGQEELEDKKALNYLDLNYTVEQNDKWGTKQGRIEKHGRHNDSGSEELQNYKKLAERTYAKNIKELVDQNGKKSNKDYENEKKVYHELRASGVSSEEIRSRLTSKKKLNTYIGKVQKWEKHVYDKRCKIDDDGKDGAIHEKNRQFNSKLKRHFSQLEQRQDRET